MRPLYEHDCDQCTFLGTFEGRDLYHCAGSRPAFQTLIERSSSDGSDYRSGIFAADTNRYIREAKRRATERGLLK
jgi:hypothetical protein